VQPGGIGQVHGESSQPAYHLETGKQSLVKRMKAVAFWEKAIMAKDRPSKKPDRAVPPNDEPDYVEMEEVVSPPGDQQNPAADDEGEFIQVEEVVPSPAKPEDSFIEAEEVTPPAKAQRAATKPEESFIEAEEVPPPATGQRAAAKTEDSFIEAEEVAPPAKGERPAAKPEDSFIEAEEVPAPKKRSRPIFDDEPAPQAPLKAPAPSAKAAKPTSSSVVRCGQCQRALRVPQAVMGKRVKCPACGSPFIAGKAQ
jgi:hypothetical protein